VSTDVLQSAGPHSTAGNQSAVTTPKKLKKKKKSNSRTVTKANEDDSNDNNAKETDHDVQPQLNTASLGTTDSPVVNKGKGKENVNVIEMPGSTSSSTGCITPPSPPEISSPGRKVWIAIDEKQNSPTIDVVKAPLPINTHVKRNRNKTGSETASQSSAEGGPTVETLQRSLSRETKLAQINTLRLLNFRHATAKVAEELVVQNAKVAEELAIANNDGPKLFIVSGWPAGTEDDLFGENGQLQLEGQNRTDFHFLQFAGTGGDGADTGVDDSEGTIPDSQAGSQGFVDDEEE
jgi:hypothetical protein